MYVLRCVALMLAAVRVVLCCTADSTHASVPADTTLADTTDTGLSIGPGRIEWREQFGIGPVYPTLTVQLIGAQSTPRIAGIPTYMPSTNIELHLGWQRQRLIPRTSAVARINGNSIGVVGLLPSRQVSDSGQVAIRGWRWGFRLESGHRYNPAGSGMYFLHTGGWTWSYVQALGGSDFHQARTSIEAFRTSHFGANTGLSIGYQFAAGTGIETRYQRVLLYNNYAFFPWLGSLLLEGLAQSLLGMPLRFAEMRNPTAAPLATLLLRSALSWSIYELRRTSGQHFPFGGNTPLLWEEVQVGIRLTF